MEVVGGARDLLQELGMSARRIAVIAVSAAADMREGIDVTQLQPTIEHTLNAVTGTQLYRNDPDTLREMQLSIARWTKGLSTSGRPVQSCFIRLSFQDLADLPLRRFLHEIPISLAPSGEQLDQLIASGRSLLRANAQLRSLVQSLDGELAAPPAPPPSIEATL